MTISCSTCNANLLSEENFTQFQCPACGKETVIRCEKCRRESRPYKCGKCGFEGP